MKKLLALLFAGALAISLAMPVFAQDSSAPADSSSTSSMGKEKKPKKAKKAKKEKKEKKSSSDTSATPPPQ